MPTQYTVVFYDINQTQLNTTSGEFGDTEDDIKTQTDNLVNYLNSSSLAVAALNVTRWTNLIVTLSNGQTFNYNR